MNFVIHTSKLSAAKFTDGYLAKIACNTNLPLSKFINLVESIYDIARSVNEGLHRPIYRKTPTKS